ncbi:MAG TPA: PhaM family polyhydroxyalkanoate granule multifunctional regulatory protein [Limnobacter sp.]|nr:PhaM family polyhydroxyalkanoate granule multifunctional regulatory protein [Limnobacter sp.]
MSNKKIPGLSVTDGFDFVKKIWGSLPIPSVMNPTTDLDELDKRISDLKAVEQWLNINLSMLRATIQGLEVQRGTIATIKSFSSNIGLGTEKAGELGQAAQDEFIRNAMQAVAVPPPMPRAEPVATRVPEPEPAPSSPEDKSAQMESSKAMISNATAWWGLLQDQFNKVAAAAMTGSGLAAAEEEKPKAVKKSNAATSKTPTRSKGSSTSSAARKTGSSARTNRTRS